MREKVILLIEEILELEPGTIKEDTVAADIAEWDSLGQIMVIGALEEKLGLSISLEQALQIKSVKDIFTLADIYFYNIGCSSYICKPLEVAL